MITSTTHCGSKHHFRKDAGKKPKSGLSEHLSEISARPARGPEVFEILQFVWVVFAFALSILIDYWAPSVWVGFVMFWILAVAGVGFMEMLRIRRQQSGSRLAWMGVDKGDNA